MTRTVDARQHLCATSDTLLNSVAQFCQKRPVGGRVLNILDINDTDVHLGASTDGVVHGVVSGCTSACRGLYYRGLTLQHPIISLFSSLVLSIRAASLRRTVTTLRRVVATCTATHRAGQARAPRTVSPSSDTESAPWSTAEASSMHPGMDSVHTAGRLVGNPVQQDGIQQGILPPRTAGAPLRIVVASPRPPVY